MCVKLNFQLETKQYALPNTLPGYWSNKDAKLIVSVDGRVQGITSGKALLTYNFGNACYQNFDTISKTDISPELI